MKSKNTHNPLPTWAWIAMILALVVIVVGVVILSKPSKKSLPVEISVTQAAHERDQGAFILDVREVSEWNQGHVPGAVLIPLGELPTRLSEVPKDRTVVVVCRTGNRSAQGRDILAQAGFHQVTSMAGGMTAWLAQGLPVTTGG